MYSLQFVLFCTVYWYILYPPWSVLSNYFLYFLVSILCLYFESTSVLTLVCTFQEVLLYSLRSVLWECTFILTLVCTFQEVLLYSLRSVLWECTFILTLVCTLTVYFCTHFGLYFECVLLYSLWTVLCRVYFCTHFGLYFSVSTFVLTSVCTLRVYFYTHFGLYFESVLLYSLWFVLSECTFVLTLDCNWRVYFCTHFGLYFVECTFVLTLVCTLRAYRLTGNSAVCMMGVRTLVHCSLGMECASVTAHCSAARLTCMKTKRDRKQGKQYLKLEDFLNDI